MSNTPIILSKEITFRDDDVSCDTDILRFRRVQELFDKYKVPHTIALVTKDIEKAPELIKYINLNNIDVQVHCYEHIDYSLEDNEIFIQPHLIESISIIKRYFDKTPTVFFPPWNNSSEKIVEVASELDLRVSVEKLSLQAFIRAGGGVKEKVVNFHYWAEEEVMFLEIALRMYVDRKSKCV